jgi:hypothetical protein
MQSLKEPRKETPVGNWEEILNDNELVSFAQYADKPFGQVTSIVELFARS